MPTLKQELIKKIDAAVTEFEAITGAEILEINVERISTDTTMSLSLDKCRKSLVLRYEIKMK